MARGSPPGFTATNPGGRSRVMWKNLRPSNGVTHHAADDQPVPVRPRQRGLPPRGSTVLPLGTGLLPGPLKDAILAIGGDNTNTLHVMQEYASLLVLVALLSFWFLRP